METLPQLYTTTVVNENLQKSNHSHEVNLISLAMTALRLTKSKTRPEDQIITMDEVSWHDQADDCWIILYDRVYNITQFLNDHPGGSDVLLESAGRDATLAFRGTGHSKGAIASLKRYYIGNLPVEERLFRKTGGIKISEMPE